LLSDFKEFNGEGHRFGMGIIETTNGVSVLARRDELLLAMDRLREHGYTSVLFAVVDILHRRSALLVAGHPSAVAAGFDARLVDEHMIMFERILSRKKDLVPQLGAISRQITAY
jgi:manganese-dependent inorganic pyrophosphatase